MSDQSLRAALEKLLTEFRKEYPKRAPAWAYVTMLGMLADLLAAHPAEPAPVVTDEAVRDWSDEAFAVLAEATGLSTFVDGLEQNAGMCDDSGLLYLRGVASRLGGLASLLGSRPLLDREAATKHLYALLRDAEQRDRDALDKLGWVGSVMPGVPEDKLRTHCAALVDAVIEMARPMPTQEQIAEAITARALVEDESFGPAPGTVEHSRALAAAVLALLNGAESYGKEHQ